MHRFFCLILLLCSFFNAILAQEQEAWFYLRAKDTLFNPRFNEENKTLQYIGEDTVFKNILEKYTLKRFKKSYRDCQSK